MNKLFLFPLMLMMFALSVFAADDFYQTSQTISIDAVYTEGGVLSAATANFSVESPQGDILINQQGMDIISTGVFKAQYTTPNATGRYLITVIFYKNSTEIGRDSRYINVGFPGAFRLGEPPQSTTQLTTMWIILGLLLLLAVLGISMNIVILTFLAGVMFLVMSVVTLPFSIVLGSITVMLGVVFLLIGAFQRT